MKLVRFGEAGKERPGLLDKDGHVRDLSSHVKDVSGDVLSDESLARIAALDPTSLPRVPDGVRLGAPVATPSKFVAIGLNYSDHAAEVGMALPTEPIIFLKAVTSICGPNDRGREAARLHKTRLGSRARHRHRQAREIHRGGCVLLAYRGLLPRQRRL